MATLDEKILDGPNVGYCSDSDEEGTNELGLQSESPSHIPRSSQGNSTGPKGVLADYRRYKRQKIIERQIAEEKLIKEAKRFTLENAGNHSDREKSDDDEDDLEKIRQRRLEQLKSLSRNRIIEIATTEQFLNVTESSSSELVFIHIYRDGLEVIDVLNDALLEISARLTSEDAKFYKVKADILGTSVHFTNNALPALQVYKKASLIGNFVRVTDELGEDFNGQKLCKFLEKHDIFPGRT